MASHKDRNLHIRLTEEESETLKKYAKENNTTQSDVLRDHIKTLKTKKGKTEQTSTRNPSLPGADVAKSLLPKSIPALLD